MNKIILILIILIIILCENQRNQGKIKLKPSNWYKEGHFILAPINRWYSKKTIGIDTPFPNMLTYFPNHIILQNNWKIIYDEALSIYKQNKTTLIKNDMFFDKIADNKWKKFYIKWHSDITNDSLKLCPKTSFLINSIPEITIAMFSVLEPGAKIIPHAGPFKGCIRYHLGLQCNKNASILVDDKRYTWKEGEDVLFDDTYVHQVTYSSSDSSSDEQLPRIILFCDIKRKMNTKLSNKISNILINNLGKLTTRANDKQEKITFT